MSIFIYQDERTFKVSDKNDKELKLKIVKPNQKQLSDADLRYKTKFAQALREKVMTRAQAEKHIRENGFMDDDTLARRDDVARQINTLRDKLVTTDDRARGLDLIKEINELRGELENINSLTIDIMNQTAEAYAEDFRLQWLASELVKNLDGSNYFEDYEDFVGEMNTSIALESIKQMILFLNNLKDNFEMEYDENKWLLNKNIINEDGSFNYDGLSGEVDDLKSDIGSVISKSEDIAKELSEDKDKDKDKEIKIRNKTKGKKKAKKKVTKKKE